MPPDELNTNLQTYIVAPLTTGSHAYPFRISWRFQGKAGHVVLDQIRTVERGWLTKKLGKLSPRALEKSLLVLQEIFAP